MFRTWLEGKLSCITLSSLKRFYYLNLGENRISITRNEIQSFPFLHDLSIDAIYIRIIEPDAFERLLKVSYKPLSYTV